MSQMTHCPFCAGSLAPGVAECPACHRSLENKNPEGALPLGTVLGGRYLVGRFVGADGEAFLYRGVEKNGGIPVQIREYFPVTLSAERSADGALQPKAGSEVMFKTTRMDFADLYHALMQVTPATGLETVLDVLEANNTVYAVLEKTGGMPLAQYLEKVGGLITPADARSILQPVFEGVAAMHGAGLVHRGISPETIFVQENNKARLSGYATIGLRTVGNGLRPQLFEGYSAPEQYSAAEFEGRYTDEYALAAVFYRMVCGRAPVPAMQRMVADSNLSARSVQAGVPAYVSKVLQLGLQLQPARRIQTVEELFEGLASPEAARALAEKVTPPKKKEAAVQGRFSVNNLLAGVLVLLAVVVLLLLWSAIGSRNPPAQSESTPAPVATATPAPEYAPNLEGFVYEQVIANQTYASKYLFYHDPTKDEYSNKHAAGVIIRQSPEPGTPMGEEYTIEVILSKGPEMATMPNVIGWQQVDAVAELRKAGLAAAVYVMENDGSYASGCVVKCDVKPDQQVLTGTTVTVYIAADRDVVITPTPTPEPTAAPTPAPTPAVEEDLN